MRMHLYNTLTRSKELFEPMRPPRVGMYCCGPTVYNYAHIGNLRTYVFEDVLRRALRMNGYELVHVMNITDVGHLESDSDEGEDKMEKGARREGLDVWQLARKYEAAWLDDMARLNIERPEVVCRATEHVGDMVALIEQLLERGYAYMTPGALYFDTSRFPQYADFARLDLRGQQAGAGGRVQLLGEKKHPNDFALWFLGKPKHIMQWDSPWGRGYPGWHIECSAMSMRYLGHTFDIHCGGVDHIPVHHTNEIAQSEAATGDPFVRYWLHGAFLIVTRSMSEDAPEAGAEGDESAGYEKMSKSADNFLTLQRLIDRGFDPLAYRYLCLQAHYRSELRFSWETLEGAQQGLRRVYSVRPDDDPLADEARFQDARQEALDALNDDLNMPRLVGLLNRHNSYRLWTELDAALGLDIAARARRVDEELPSEIMELVEQRNAARTAREWARSDELRDRLVDLGYEVGDSPRGTKVTRRTV
ncbi:MAG: cysteine--tRNA ligase [Chthonomonadales bacterium]|nr:cysteine--tRNA ligase [Chthonomonadales bacterium]